MKKQYDLFGNEILFLEPTKKRKKGLFDDYDGFVDKFKAKKTTDDCYTPANVYECCLRYVNSKYPLKGLQVVRPFYPGGDYENCEYPDNCVVIDNPPFSIISRIVAFYVKNGIKFFLFAPHLTMFSSSSSCSRLVVGVEIVYENGAHVKTSFLTNLLGDIAIMSDYEFYCDLENASKENIVTANLPKYRYPNNVLTVSMIQWCLDRGVNMKFTYDQVYRIGGLDDQKKYGKAIFGSGFLISEKAAAEKSNVIEFKLSPREIEIIKSLK